MCVCVNIHGWGDGAGRERSIKQKFLPVIFFLKKSVKQVIIGINTSVDNKKGTVLLQVINLERQKKRITPLKNEAIATNALNFSSSSRMVIS